MFWKKKKRMIDVRELQKRGVIRIPRNNVEIPTDKDGFVKISSESGAQITPTISQTPSTQSEGNFFGFMDSSAQSHQLTAEPSQDLRKISAQISNLDNKLYKLEQRIELLERKAGVS